MSFSGPKWPICPEQNFNHLPIYHFHCTKLKIILTADPELRCAIFDPFVLNKIFLVQTIIITFIYPLAFFIVQNFKKFLQQIQNYEDEPFSGPKWPICPAQNFFGTNHYYYFHLPTGPFHCAKFKKILTVDSEL